MRALLKKAEEDFEFAETPSSFKNVLNSAYEEDFKTARQVVVTRAVSYGINHQEPPFFMLMALHIGITNITVEKAN